MSLKLAAFGPDPFGLLHYAYYSTNRLELIDNETRR